MTEDFKRFFEAVQQCAEACGVEAYAVAGVRRAKSPGQVIVASNAFSKIESQDETFTERYCDAMGESLEMALNRLAGGADDDDEIEYMN